MHQDDQFDWSRIYSALAHDGRRELLADLLDGGDASTEELARSLLGGVDEHTETELSVVVTGLYHVHLPKLVEAGLLTWDRERDRIAPTAVASRLPTDVVSPRPLPRSDPGNKGSAAN